MRKGSWSIIYLLLVVGLLSFSSGCGAGPGGKSGADSASAEPYKIGAVFAITGPASSLGVPERNTVEMLQAHYEEQGGILGPDGLMHPLEVIIYDTESDETKGLLALKKLIAEDKVSVIVGPSTSGVTLAMVDAVNKAEVPLISCASSIKITEPVSERKWVFNTVHSDRMVSRMMADYFVSQGITQLAIMNMNNAYGDSGRAEFEKAAAETGLTIVASDKFEATDTDMTTQLTRIRGTDAQGIVIWAIPPSSAVLTKNAYDMGLEIPIFHNHAVGNQTFIDLATKEAAEGILIPVPKIMVAEQLPDDDPQKTTLVGYATEYRDKYGTRPTSFGGHAWDAFQLSVNALEKVGPARAAIRDELENTQDFVGVSAVLDYSASNHNGINGRGVAMATIQDGEWILVK